MQRRKEDQAYYYSRDVIRGRVSLFLGELYLGEETPSGPRGNTSKEEYIIGDGWEDQHLNPTTPPNKNHRTAF